MAHRSNKSPTYYFALPRLISAVLGHPSNFSERNPIEVYVGNIVTFAVPYLTAAQLLVPPLPGGWTILIYMLLLIAVWIFWLLVLYANSLVIKLLRACGLFRKTADRFIQDVIIWFVVALGASYLATSSSPIRWLGMIAFALIALNLSSALVLRVIQGALPQGATETSPATE